MKSKTRKSLTTWLILIVIAIIIGYFLGKGRRVPSLEKTSKVKIPQLILTSKALNIIKELNCACGSCSEVLINCNCNNEKGGLEMKKFIQTKVDAGLTKSQVLKKIVEKYGKIVLIKQN